MRSFDALRKIGAGLALFALSVTTFAQNKGFDLTRMDKDAEACEDFYQFANGGWDKRTQIPADRSRYGSFDILNDNNRAVLREILEASVKTANAKPGSNEQLIGDFYASCMNEAAIEAAGASPLDPFFQEINAVRDARGLQIVLARLHKAGFPAVFNFGASADLKNSVATIASASQGGLSLPNRDYYLEDRYAQTRQQFVAHVANMFKLLGEPEAKARANAEAVMKMQTRLAAASKKPVEIRDPENRYNKMKVAEVKTLAPNVALEAYAAERGAPRFTELNVGQPAFFKEVNQMFSDVSLEDWKTYLRWMVLNAAAPRLSRKFVDENFDFFSRKMQGTKEQQPRWRRCIEATNSTLGEALGQEYVKRSFTPQQKARMNVMIDNLLAAFRERITKLDWMTEPTRREALTKLSTFKRKIGFPDKWRGYAGLSGINRKSYFQNGLRVIQFESSRNIKDIGRPTDKTRWGFTTPTVNASYSGTFNDITFPAGILQPPFFNFEADDAINYGGIGAVIGHELSHGFDDQGSKFDAAGNYRMWWTPEDRKRFEEKASCVSRQFSSYEVLPGVFMKGDFTLGENIGDLGGLTVAFDAFKKSLQGKPRPANIDGFTPEQRFFLGYAQIWSQKATPEFVKFQVSSDPHAIARWRVNGPLSNLPYFAETWGCKTGDKMVRDERCEVW